MKNITTYLPTYLTTYLPNYLPTYLPTYLTTYINKPNYNAVNTFYDVVLLESIPNTDNQFPKHALWFPKTFSIFLEPHFECFLTTSILSKLVLHIFLFQKTIKKRNYFPLLLNQLLFKLICEAIVHFELICLSWKILLID